MTEATKEGNLICEGRCPSEGCANRGTYTLSKKKRVVFTGFNAGRSCCQQFSRGDHSDDLWRERAAQSNAPTPAPAPAPEPAPAADSAPPVVEDPPPAKPKRQARAKAPAPAKAAGWSPFS